MKIAKEKPKAQKRMAKNLDVKPAKGGKVRGGRVDHGDLSIPKHIDKASP